MRYVLLFCYNFDIQYFDEYITKYQYTQYNVYKTVKTPLCYTIQSGYILEKIMYIQFIFLYSFGIIVKVFKVKTIHIFYDYYKH